MDAFELLTAVRASAGTRRAKETDFTSPTGADPLHIALPKPGVVHPLHFEWIAECLGQPVEAIRRTLYEPDPQEPCGVRRLARELERARPSPTLKKLGAKPIELVLTRWPIASGDARPNLRAAFGTNPVLSPVNAALQMFFRGASSVERLVDLAAPEIIIDNRINVLQQELLDLESILQGRGPRFEPPHDAIRAELIVSPPRCGWAGKPLLPLQAVVSGRTAIVKFPAALACIDLDSGHFSTQPLGQASLISVRDGLAYFSCGNGLAVFDAARRELVAEAPGLPRRLVVGACCGICVLDMTTRMTTTLPGPLASSPFGVVTSPCGRYAWLECAPSLDDVGILCVEELVRVYQPWPHPTLGSPPGTGDSTEGHDDTVRALVRLPDGAFRCVYGEHVFQGSIAHRLAGSHRVAAFERDGSQLITVDERELWVHRLGSAAEPTVAARWSLEALVPHLALPDGAITDERLDAGTVMAAVGTVGELAGYTVVRLAEELYVDADETREPLAQLIAAARGASLPTSLVPSSR